MDTILDRGPLQLDGFQLRIEYSLSEALKLSHRAPGANTISVPSTRRQQMMDKKLHQGMMKKHVLPFVFVCFFETIFFSYFAFILDIISN